ncbi:hypothetical protein PUN28_012849 [Cardiocondyla obscurior]|uniref:Uncharacterized protein n=1 Tax=Cardiocondyla obscurior TaxID=286306 RepID=A0AAW2F9P1_9HYME
MRLNQVTDQVLTSVVDSIRRANIICQIFSNSHSITRVSLSYKEKSSSVIRFQTGYVSRQNYFTILAAKISLYSIYPAILLNFRSTKKKKKKEIPPSACLSLSR